MFRLLDPFDTTEAATEIRTIAPGKRTLTERLMQRRAAPAGAVAAPAATAAQAPPVATTAAPASGSFVDEILGRSSGSGEALPEPLRAKMEASFATSFADVRVFEGGEASRAGALAYASGDELHFAPGQYDPGSARGQELIGHELAHVVQQREGRVAATGQAAGLAINDDDGLEREADEQGRRAAAGEAARPGRAAPASTAAPRVQRKVVQRRVGFEFESTHNSGWHFEGQRADGGWEGIGHTKAILLDTDDGRGGISADNGHVEFVTRPLTSLAEIQGTIGQLLGLRDRFRNRTTQLADDERDTARGREANQHQEIRVRVEGNGLITRPQATTGVTLADIPRLFETAMRLQRTLMRGPAYAVDRANAAATRGEIIGGADRRTAQRLVGGDVTRNMDLAAQQARAAYAEAVAALGAAPPRADGVPRVPAPADPAEIIGLLTIVLYTLYAANRDAGVDDMKYAFPLMARTDFRSMVRGMEHDAQAYLMELWDGGNGPLAARLEAKLADAEVAPVGGADDARAMDDPMFPGGYGADGGHVHHGPTRTAWVSSMVDSTGRNAAQHRDELSPAPGYARLEGLGALGADDQNAKLNLFEFRGLAAVGQNATISSDEWLGLAEAFFRLVDFVQNPPAPAPVEEEEEEDDDAGEGAPMAIGGPAAPVDGGPAPVAVVPALHAVMAVLPPADGGGGGAVGGPGGRKRRHDEI
jgi:hypothetical protein